MLKTKPLALRSRAALPLLLLLLSVVAAAPPARAQDASPDAPFTAPSAIPPTAVITYTHDFPPGQPQFVSMTIDARGGITYESRGPVGRQMEGVTAASAPETYRLRFTLLHEVRDKIFELARQTGYFSRSYDFTRHPVANTGKKTLGYSDAGHRFQASYVWSEDQNIRELSEIFQNISNTMEAGRRLEYCRRYDRLGLEAELRNMEVLAKSHNLLELHAIYPILNQIASDPRVLKLARQRALRLSSLADTGNL